MYFCFSFDLEWWIFIYLFFVLITNPFYLATKQNVFNSYLFCYKLPLKVSKVLDAWFCFYVSFLYFLLRSFSLAHSSAIKLWPRNTCFAFTLLFKLLSFSAEYPNALAKFICCTQLALFWCMAVVGMWSVCLRTNIIWFLISYCLVVWGYFRVLRRNGTQVLHL